LSIFRLEAALFRLGCRSCRILPLLLEPERGAVESYPSRPSLPNLDLPESDESCGAIVVPPRLKPIQIGIRHKRGGEVDVGLQY